MFGNKGKFYSVYVSSKKEQPLHDIEVVPNGFNFFGFLLKGIWALFHKVWPLVWINISFAMIIIYASINNYLSVEALDIISLLFALWCGFEANNFKEESLINRDYNLMGTVFAYSEDEARLNFIKQYNNQHRTCDRPTKLDASEEFICDDVNPISSPAAATASAASSTA